MMNGKGAVRIAAVVALASLFGALAAAARLDLKPGKYALTITYEVQDQRQNESRSATRCITPRDLSNPEKIFNDRIAAAPKKEEACAVKDLSSAGGKISYDAECSNRTVHVEGNLSGTGFSVVRTVKPKASQGVSLKFTVRGRRMGDCPMAGGR
ncbi:MAG: DUF3617 domain-containing protein [Candidatus Acidiferrales bacterium]